MRPHNSLASNGNNFTLEGMRHVVTILDNDQPEEPMEPPVASLPTVSLVDSGSGNIVEGNLRRLTIMLSEALAENVMVNIVSGGDSTYGTGPTGTGGDWGLRYEVVPAGGTSSQSDLLSAPCSAVTGTSCQVTITAGSTLVDVEVQAYTDVENESNEDIILSISLPSASMNLVEVASSPIGITIANN